MSLTEKLNEIKTETDSLITYANGVTGANDTRLGDAVKTLADGFGSGGGSGDLEEYWFGTFPKGAEVFYTVEDTINLADTDFASKTPSKSAQTILAAVASKWTPPALDFNNYDYVVVYETVTPHEYTQDMTGKIAMNTVCTMNVYYLHHKLNISNYTNEAIALTAKVFGYYKTSKEVTTSTSAGSGVYAATPTAPTFSSSSSATPTIRLSQPALSIKGHSIYMPVASYSYLDTANTNVIQRYTIYRFPKSEKYFIQQMRDRISDAVNQRTLQPV